MAAFRILLIALFVGIAAYTAIVVANHGLGLLEVFVSDVRAMGWRGQFDVDFACYLALSALWVAWRHRFSPLGLLLAVVAFFSGALFFTLYLLLATWAAKGDIIAVLLGPDRARARGNVTGASR